MAANATNEYRVFRYYEGMCASGDFPKELAKVLSLGVKTQGVKDIDGNVLEEPFVLRAKNWDIVYPVPDSSLGFNLNDMTKEQYRKKILNQVDKISDTVILRTETTRKEITKKEFDEFSVDTDTNKDTLVMYLEIYKPTYLANPEEYPLDCERNGITPKVITKQMYIDSMRNYKAKEEFAHDLLKLKPTITNDTSIGTIELTQDLCDNYVMKIQDIIGSLSAFSAPTTDGSSVSITLDSSMLAKVKQSSADVYDLIITTLNNGEGIEPKVYMQLDNVTLTLTKNDTVFDLAVKSSRPLTTYAIKNGQTVTVSETPLERIVPEFYLDGVYIPLDPDKYVVNGKTITFKDNIKFEAINDGLLVFRYNYNTGNAKKIISDRATILNNHYVLMRLFDNINEEGTGPAENIYNANGDIIQTNSHISPWAKLSWYQDFEELMVDTLDMDIPINQIHDGTVVVPLETPGLTQDTKIRYWLNTNNDRFSFVVMGNPSLDFLRDRHLISGCYCGRIDSFDHSINDTAGNFALFTSSSTEPCNTYLNIEKKISPIKDDFILSEETVTSHTVTANDQAEIDKIVESAKDGITCKDTIYNPAALGVYNVMLSDKRYFARDVWPMYIVLNAAGAPKTGLTLAYDRNFIVEDGKSNTMVITLQPYHLGFTDSDKLYILYSSYEEMYHITGGVTRDVFGNVVNVDKIDTYGKNTSDGVTSIMMYHTRSKAYYQKHHMLFATTEEYMSKVMYGKSSYTGEYYADRIKVTHGNDGPRGTMVDILVIDSSSLYPMDELVINKDFEKEPDELEETFIYFPITAPFSPLSDSPNSRYGLAIKKEEREPVYADEDKILAIAVNQLGTICAEWNPTETNIIPPDKTDNGCSVYWKLLDGTNGTENTLCTYTNDGVKIPGDYNPVKLAVKFTSENAGDMTTMLAPAGQLTIAQGDTAGTTDSCFVKLSNFTPVAGDIILYGVCDEDTANALQAGLGTGTDIKVTMHDGSLSSTMPDETFIYNVDIIPCTGEINIADITDGNEIEIVDADPDKYLVLYSVTHDETINAEKDIISRYDIVALKDGGDRNDLLQYPCNVSVTIESGNGQINWKGNNQDYVVDTVPYHSTQFVGFIPADGYAVEKIITYDPDGPNDTGLTTAAADMTSQTINGNVVKGVELPNLAKDYKIAVHFEKTT